MQSGSWSQDYKFKSHIGHRAYFKKLKKKAKSPSFAIKLSIFSLRFHQFLLHVFLSHNDIFHIRKHKQNFWIFTTKYDMEFLRSPWRKETQDERSCGKRASLCPHTMHWKWVTTSRPHSSTSAPLPPIHPTLEWKSFRLPARGRRWFPSIQTLGEPQAPTFDYQMPPSGPKCKAHQFEFLSSLEA